MSHGGRTGDSLGEDCAFFFPPHLEAWGRASQMAQAIKNPPADAGGTGDMDLIPGSGRSPGGGNGNPLQYSCLGNIVDRGGWQATVHGVTKELDTTE